MLSGNVSTDTGWPPKYFEAHSYPQQPADLQTNTFQHYRFPNTGELEQWPLPTKLGKAIPDLPHALICNSVEMRIYLALQGQGLAYLPDFIVAENLRAGRLQIILDYSLIIV